MKKKLLFLVITIFLFNCSGNYIVQKYDDSEPGWNIEDEKSSNSAFGKALGETENLEIANREAEIVAVFVQSWFKKEDENSCEFFDIDQEKDFSIKELGHDRAVEEAKQYASELCTKYDTDWEWY